MSDINKTTPLMYACSFIQPLFLLWKAPEKSSIRFAKPTQLFFVASENRLPHTKKMYFHEFHSFIFVCFFFFVSFHLQVVRCWNTRTTTGWATSTAFFCFKWNGIFCAQTIYCRFVAVSNAMCNQCVVCAVCVLFRFLFCVCGIVSRLWQLACSLCVAAAARQAKGQRQRWNTCTKSLPRVRACNTTFQCHPNEIVSLFSGRIITFSTFFFLQIRNTHTKKDWSAAVEFGNFYSSRSDVHTHAARVHSSVNEKKKEMLQPYNWNSISSIKAI